jgi:D-aspartate ligase
MGNSNLAIVLGLYFPGIDLIKSFQKRSIKCIGIDCNPQTPGFHIRKTPTFLCPDPDINEKDWISFILRFKDTSNNKPVLLITSDKFISPVLKNSELLRDFFLFNNSNNYITEKLSNKRTLMELAIKEQVPVPKTVFFNNIQSLDPEIEQLNYPCIIRPGRGKKWLEPPLINFLKGAKLIKVDNPAELVFWLDKISQLDDDLIIQEIIEGPDSNLLYLVCYIDSNQKCLGYFCGQKLRIIPIHFGSASYMKTVSAQPILDQALTFLKRTKYFGIAGIEFKKDDRDGIYKLVEINTRFGLWDIMGSKLGVDLFYIAYQDLIKVKQNPSVPREKTLFWLSLKRDITAFKLYHKEGSITFRDWIKSFFGRTYFADLYWSEPKIIYYVFIKRYLNKILK